MRHKTGKRIQFLWWQCKRLSVAGLMLVFATSALADSGFSSWRQEQISEYKSFKELRDKQFTELLEQGWVSFDTSAGQERDTTPKPAVIPKAKLLPDSKTDRPATIKKIIRKSGLITPVIKPAAASVEPRPVKPKKILTKNASSKSASVMLELFGNPIELQVPKEFVLPKLNKLDNASISEAWKNMSQSEFESLVSQLEAIAARLQLNDWAKVYTVNQVAAKLSKGNNKVLLSWFLLAKQGYDARVAHDKKTVFLLMPAKDRMYARTFLSIGEKVYYVISFEKAIKKGALYTYEGAYQGADVALDMSFSNDIHYAGAMSTREVQHQGAANLPRLSYAVNPNEIAFLKTYPQLELEHYFAAGISKNLRDSLIQQITPMLKGKNEKEAVNFLLNLVQSSLAYATDAEQFGEENYLLVEETLYYPSSDCEDRSILFAWLVRAILDLDVVALVYPGHVATAVAFQGQVSGDHVIYEGVKYTVSDPTYTNARAGNTMPQFKDIKPKIIHWNKG